MLGGDGISIASPAKNESSHRHRHFQIKPVFGPYASFCWPTDLRGQSYTSLGVEKPEEFH